MYQSPYALPPSRTFHSSGLRLFGWLSLVIFSIFLSGSAEATGQTATNFAIGSTAKLTGAKHLGINISSEDTYDSAQMMKNLLYQSPGFEGESWQSILNCVVTSPTTCQDADIWGAWPANFLQGATFQFIYGAANGQTGTIASNTASNYAGNAGVILTFSAPLSPAPAPGDYLIVRMNVPGNAQAGWTTSTSGGATIGTDTTDIAPDSPGKQAIALTAAQSGQSAMIVQAFDTTTGRSFVQLKGTYTIAFKAKGLGGNNQLNVSISRLGTSHGNEDFINQNVTLTNAWQDYSYTFNANEDGTYIGPVDASFSVSGASIYMDDVSLTPAATASNPTDFRDEVVARLKTLQPGVLRYMNSSMLGSSIDNILAVPFARERAGFDEGTTENDSIAIGLPEFLALCQEVGAEPWFTVPSMTSPAEMQNLIQYLAGASTTTYGAIRAAQGQSAPWTSVFPMIHLELGNEMWNGGAFWGQIMLNSTAYGNRAATIFAAARSTAGYDPTKFDLVLSSQAVNIGVTSGVMAASSGYDSVDGAPYLFNTLYDYSSNEAIFGPMFAQPEEVDSVSSGYMAQTAQAALAGPAPAKVEVYEVNLSTVTGSASQNTITQVAAGTGSGIAVADHMLLMMRDLGITTQNMFTLPGFLNGFSNGNTVPLWGSVVDMGGQTNVSRPTFLAEQLANTAIMPTMLGVTVTGANPTWNQPLSQNDNIQLANAHYLQSFAFTDGTHYSAVVFNLSRSGSLPITFSGTNAPTGDVVISQLTSQNITDNNENLTSNTPVVGITTNNVTNFNPATQYSLPPFSMTVFSWPGSTLPSSTTTLSANPTSGTPGQSVTLTATVNSQSTTSTPTGTVTFMNGGTTLGTQTLNASGVATLTTTALPAGADSITASYGGDANDAGSNSAAVTVNIASSTIATTTALQASPTQINSGASVTFTATVTPKSGSTVPTGSVTFLNGTTELGSATLTSTGTAVFSSSVLTAGADSITASYGGSSTNGSSVSSAVVVNVTQTTVATTTALAASASEITPGQSVTFTATVTPKTGTAVPTGTVNFLNGKTQIGTGTLNASGSASFSTTALAAGTDSITASYAGTANDSSSVSSAVTVNVTQSAAATTTTLTSSATQITAGQSVTFTAKAAAQSGSTAPAGTVSFLNGSSILGTSTLNANGIATFSTTALPAGSDAITASYGGSTKFSSSTSAALNVKVTQTTVATTTSLTASATQINTGQGVTLTATVSPKTGSITPSGTVTFLNGTTTLGTGALNGSGIASFSTASLPAGADSITASYAGNSGDSSSVSAAVTVTVGQSYTTTTTTLTASATQIKAGQNVTFTATVGVSGGAVPSGTVALLDGGAVIGTAPLNAKGAATFNITSLASGTHSITASYGGAGIDSGSTSTSISVQVTQATSEGAATAPSTTILTASPAQAVAGQTVLLTAVVTPHVSGTPTTGLVTFSNGSVTLGSAALSGGSASLAITSLPAGTDYITADYGGDALNLASFSPAVQVTVAPAVVANAPNSPSSPGTTTNTPGATTAALTASASQVTAGQSVTLNAVITSQSGSGVPAGSVTFHDGQTTLGTGTLDGSGKASLNAILSTTGTNNLTVSYAGDANDAASTSPAVAVTVAAPSTPSYTMAVSNSTVSVSSGQIANLTVTLTPVNGFNSNVTLTCSGAPVGTSCSFAPPSVTPNGAPVSSTLSILVAPPTSSSTTAANHQGQIGPFGGKLAVGLVMPWGIISLLGLARPKNRTRLAAWTIRLMVTVALIAGSLWVSGCGYGVNQSVFTMTLTAAGQNVPTQTSQITVNIAK